jgi:hypothetical protein
MGVRPWLISRERVAAEDGRSLTVHNFDAIDGAIEYATDAVERHCRISHFWPFTGTKYFTWPVDDTSSNYPSHRLWLDPHALITLTTLTTGGQSVTDVRAYPDNRQANEPAWWLELDRAGSSAWSTGSTGTQRQVAVTGVWGWSDESVTAGVLDGSATDSATTVAVERAAYGLGVGHLLRIEDERMLVTGRAAVDTGENAAAALAAYDDSTIAGALPVADGTDFAVGETIAIDAEDMLIERIVANTLYVRRAVNGTTLADHLISADIYAYRRFEVVRGAAGTTAAAHADGLTVTRWKAPPAPAKLALALALDDLVQSGAAYARTSGDGENQRDTRTPGLTALWKRVEPYRRKGLTYAI